MVDRMYVGEQFAVGDGVTEEFGGRFMVGGGWSSSATWNGCIKSMVCKNEDGVPPAGCPPNDMPPI